MGKANLEVRNISHFYGHQKILDIPGLSVEPGEILVILGPNGSGKSTLLRILNLLEKPNRGSVYLDGREITASKTVFAWRRRMAMVFQEPLLFNASVFENVAFGLKVRRMPQDQARSRVDAVLKRLGISSLATRSALKLSGGEARRVSLARALVLEPEIFFLDEPLVSLDQPTRVRVQEDLRSVLKERRQTTVYVTHNHAEAMLMADRLGIMHRGRILQLGMPEDIFNHPANEWVASFMGMETILPGTIVSRRGSLTLIRVANKIIKASLSSPAIGRVLIGIRPEEVLLSQPGVRRPMRTFPNGAGDAGGTDENILPATITKITPQGYLAKVQLDCDFPLVSLTTKDSIAAEKLATGQPITARFEPAAVRLISP